MVLLVIAVSVGCAKRQLGNRAAQDASGAIVDGENAKLQSLLQEGLDPNARTFNAVHIGPSLLEWATNFRNVTALKMLLDSGADPNEANASGATPLMLSGNCADCFALLLKHGANATMQDKRGGTALSYIASIIPGPETQTESNLVMMIQKLLAAHADPNAHGKGDLSALGYAITGGNDQVAELLVHVGASVNEVNRDEATPLILASARGEVKVARSLIAAGANVSSRDARGLDALDEATLMGNEETATLLRHAGARSQPVCAGVHAPSNLQRALRFFLCSRSVRIVYRGGLGHKGMDFVVAGIPASCPKISIWNGDAPKTGQVLGYLVVLRKTVNGWRREFTQDYFSKNYSHILSEFIVARSTTTWLVPGARMIRQDYKNGFSFWNLDSCTADGLAYSYSWDSARGRVELDNPSGGFEPEGPPAN